MAKQYISAAVTVLSLEIQAVNQAEFKQFIQKKQLFRSCLRLRIWDTDKQIIWLGHSGEKYDQFPLNVQLPMRKIDGNFRTFCKQFF